MLELTALCMMLNGPEDPLAVKDALAGSPEGAPLPEDAQGVGDPFPSGLNLRWLGSWNDNLRFTLDLSGRFEYDTAREEWSITQFYGFDLYKVLSDERRDYATVVLQGFATRIDNNPAPPWFFDGSTDWQWIYRMFYINWKLAPRHAINLKVGHFEMPFGLESLIDTNGTLRQVGTAANLGIKADWGATLNGVSGGLEYEVGLGRGSGNEWHAAGSPYTLVGRLGTVPVDGWWVGVSGFSADLYRPGATIERRRIGLDAGVEWGAWTLMGELSGGTNAGDDALNGLCELNWRSPAESWFGYGQLRTQRQRTGGAWSGPVQSALGVEWAPDSHWTLSAEWVQNLRASANGSREASIRFQAMYRF